MSKIQELTRVVEQHQVALQTYRLRLYAPDIARRARAGQFAMLQAREGMDPLLRRPFSFHRILPEDGVVEILYRVVGKGTWWLSQAAPGDRLSLLGPLGNSFEPPPSPAPPPEPGPSAHFQPREASTSAVILIAGGIGIAPLMEWMHQLRERSSDGSLRSSFEMHLFYGARTGAELLPQESFDGLGVKIHWCTDDGSLGHHGLVTQLLQITVERENLRPAALYSCGPLAMQFNVARWAVAHGTASQLSLEALMACGLGACLGCALPAFHPTDPTADHYVHVCKDGPIFSAGSIKWQKIQLYRTAPPTFLYS